MAGPEPERSEGGGLEVGVALKRARVMCFSSGWCRSVFHRLC